jgi:hypothetical protein
MLINDQFINEIRALGLGETLLDLVLIFSVESKRPNPFANDLSTGVYTYSLVADGQIVSTKQIVKEKL